MTHVLLPLPKREGLYMGSFSLLILMKDKMWEELRMLLNTRLVATHLTRWCIQKLCFYPLIIVLLPPFMFCAMCLFRHIWATLINVYHIGISLNKKGKNCGGKSTSVGGGRFPGNPSTLPSREVVHADPYLAKVVTGWGSPLQPHPKGRKWWVVGDYPILATTSFHLVGIVVGDPIAQQSLLTQ